ncbi:PREDICTED: double-stranded RNA-binding protein 4 [Tarenaya hassleriana]|uniref:double-stranded RNA-binding protein 4 n=1 Tax=Tarenaya hassleriana TaxID=28532 RepID=UPI00053C9F01|nr:PREDICTED: double-stranded RNA-binding protein 4 [Tarenaya hassleriana]
MYKSKLQDACHRQRWELPVYAVKREGPDHDPRFQATVVIDGVAFQSRESCRSIKQAQNEAARVALGYAMFPSAGSSSSKNVSANTLSNQQTHLEERTEGGEVPVIGVSLPVVEEHSRTKGISQAISVPTKSITTQQRFQQEVDQVPVFIVSTPVVKDDNKTKDALHASHELKNSITRRQGIEEIREVGRILASSSLIKEDNTTKAVSYLTTEPTNRASIRHILQEQRRELDPVVRSLPLISSNKMKDVNNLCKSQLQTYTQKKNLCMPTYIRERVGLLHACRFRCKVVVNEQTFESRELFSTLREAENAAAKIALVSLVPNASQEVDSLVYKNLLQELTQKKNMLLPIYATSRSGASHSPTFLSTVEVGGKFFGGQEAKTRKLAEMSAAKVAYMSLTGMPRETLSLPLPSEQQEKPHEAFHAGSSASNGLLDSPLTRGLRRAVPDVPSKWVEVDEEEPLSSELIRVPLRIKTPSEKEMDASSMVENHTGNDSTVSSVDEIAKKLGIGTGSRGSSPGEHVVVRPFTPGMTIPMDSELLYKDDKWVAFRPPSLSPKP